MQTLIWKAKNVTKRLVPTGFQSEEEFEKAVFGTPEILEDVFLIKRQVRGGNKAGIPDIIGIDNNGNVCVIEMKNVKVDASIVPQVLQYAIWAETNPDSIKSLWLECRDKPDDLTVSWDDFQVRVLVIAPRILKSTLGVVGRINYQIDLIEISRWVDGENHLLLVNKLDTDEPNRPKPVGGLEVYDAEYYQSHFNVTSAKAFVRVVHEVEAIVQKEKWTLETKFNKYYCGFKAGFFNAFGIKWVGSKTFAFFLKLPKSEAAKFKPPMTKYDSQWKEAVYYIDPATTKTASFAGLFRASYERLTGGS